MSNSFDLEKAYHFKLFDGMVNQPLTKPTRLQTTSISTYEYQQRLKQCLNQYGGEKAGEDKVAVCDHIALGLQ